MVPRRRQYSRTTLHAHGSRRYDLFIERARRTLHIAHIPRPECWTDCPLLAAQLRQVRSDLSPGAKLDIVAVAADPYHETLANVNHFIDIHGLKSVKDFYFVTGHCTRPEGLGAYGIGVSMVRRTR